MGNNNKKLLLIIGIVTAVLLIAGGTFAYWRWQSTNADKTNVTFTIASDFSCSADGGGDITNNNYFAPAACTNSTYALKRTITTNITNTGTNPVNMNMWLNIDDIGTGLSNSDNFKYALTTDPTDCTTGLVSGASGTFKGKKSGDTIPLLSGVTAPGTYYLWVWLDAAETSPDTINQSVKLSLGGECSNQVNSCPSSSVPVNNSTPNAPVLDSGMIPVKIANNGTVTTVSSNDSSWYNYQNKEWANVVLVKESGVKTRTENKVAGTVINLDDILAYYVWIPRYKYAIPEAQTCGCISNVNETDYPGCYSPSMTPEEKANFLAWGDNNGYTTVSNNTDADQFIQDEINAGYFSTDIDEYNEANDPDIVVSYELQNDKVINYPRTIDIVFENGTPAKSTGTAVGTSYYTHPAFTFGTQELSGIWVGKFEMSHNTLSSSTTSNNLGCTNETCTNASGLRILPNVSSIRYNRVSNMWYATRSMEQSNNVFGITSTDSHMMKNSEWGAVAYLSHSNYGINEEIRINNNSNYTTGCGASTANASSSTTCDITYGGSASYPQSTTGNISGIFDMSGGSWEYVMGNYNGATDSSGFSTLPNAKYYDNYPSSIFTGNNNTNMTFCTLGTCGGHALNETANWYGDYADFVGSGSPWFSRGGSCSVGLSAGAFSGHDSDGGSSHFDSSWRGVCVAK